MPFRDTNKSYGLPSEDKFQFGVSDCDQNSVLEQNIGIPWSSDPAASYMYYECTVGVMLDSGIVVHNRLPQVNNLPDSLSSVSLDSADLATITTAGVNLKCQDQYQDIVQRMGHARYWFRLWGQALRAGYKVPIPGIKFIGGVPAIPYDRNPQWGVNRIFRGGNYGGVILWHANWSLWYTTAVPPTSQAIPTSNPFAHISGDVRPPEFMQAAFSRPDDNVEVGRSIGEGIGTAGKPTRR